MRPENPEMEYEMLKAFIKQANTEELQAAVHGKILELLRSGVTIQEIAEGLGIKAEKEGTGATGAIVINIRVQLAKMFPIKFAVKARNKKAAPNPKGFELSSKGQKRRKKEPQAAINVLFDPEEVQDDDGQLTMEEVHRLVLD